MGLIIKGTPLMSGNIKVKVPTLTYSGSGAPSSPSATNPYTGLSPFVTITTVFNYTGALQNIILPGNASSVSIVMWGAGAAGSQGFGTSTGGPGGFSSGTFAILGGETLDIIVGGGGISGGLNTPNPAPGGFGGGGNGGSGFMGTAGGGSGGGRSSIGINGAVEIITAGGGGGGSAGIGLGHPGGFGGGLTGGNGEPFTSSVSLGGGQNAFTTGAGTTGTSNGSNTGGGGGGGGWNGGLGGSGTSNSTSGGGGSAHNDVIISNFITQTGTVNVGTAPQNTNPDYVAGIGEGGHGLIPGGNGLIVVRYSIG